MFRFSLALLVTLTLTSCSWVAGSGAPPELTRENELPFEVTVQDEVTDGHTLHLLVGLMPKADWSGEELAFRLTTLNGIETIFSRQFPLNRILNNQSNLKAGQPIAVSLASPAERMTDYQLEVLWGEEARASLAQFPATLEISGLHFIQAPQSCPALPCEITYKVEAQLLNNTDTIINSAKLGIGYRWQPRGLLDSDSTIPQNEENILLDGLKLSPGSSRALKLELASAVTLTEAGRYVPNLRVISFQ